MRDIVIRIVAFTMRPRVYGCAYVLFGIWFLAGGTWLPDPFGPIAGGALLAYGLFVIIRG
jgi:hypothetical protein